MNKYYKKLLVLSISVIIISIFIYSSTDFQEEKFKKKMASDSLWLQFAHCMETNDIQFLMENSLDTIQCAECNLDGKSENEYYESRFVFEKHIDKLMHLNSLHNRYYSIYQDDSLMHVVYSVKTTNTVEGGYNLIFNFIKVDDKYLFKGMIMTP